MFLDICDRYAGPNASLSDLRLATICVTAYTASLSYNKLASLCCCKLVFAILLSRFMLTKVKRMFIGMVPSLVGKNRVRFLPFQSASQIRFSAANLDLSSSLPVFCSLYFHKATRLYLQRNSFTSVC